MCSPSVLLGHKNFVRMDGAPARIPSEFSAFAWPALAVLALLLAWPLTASAQSPAGAGGQQQPPVSDQQAPAAGAQDGATKAPKPVPSQPATPTDLPVTTTPRPQQALTPEAV